MQCSTFLIGHSKCIKSSADNSNRLTLGFSSNHFFPKNRPASQRLHPIKIPNTFDQSKVLFYIEILNVQFDWVPRLEKSKRLICLILLLNTNDDSELYG